MKTNKLYLKAIPLLLSLILFMQSCAVYDSVPMTAQEAIDSYQNRKSQKYWKVKIISETNEYKFKYLAEQDGKIYGITKDNSKTAKLLSNQVVDSINMIHKKYSFNNHIKIPLTNEQAGEVYLIDKGKTIRNGLLVAIPIAAGAMIGFYYLIEQAFWNALTFSLK